MGQRQCFGDGRCLQWRKARAFGEMFKHKTLPVKLVGVFNRTTTLQQGQHTFLAAFGGVHHRFVFGAVFVGLEQNAVQVFAHRRWANPFTQLGGPSVNLRLDLRFFLDGSQCLSQDVGRRLFVAAFARAPKIVRCAVHTNQRGGFFFCAALGAEILGRQIGKAKFILGGKFIGQRQLHVSGHGSGALHQLGGGGFVEFEQRVGGLHLDAFAAVEFHLQRAVGFGQDAAGLQFAGVVKQ